MRKIGWIILLGLAVAGCKDPKLRSAQQGMGMGWGGGGGTGSSDSPLPDPVVSLLGELKLPRMRAPARIAVGGPHQRIHVSDPRAGLVHVITRTGVYRFGIRVDSPLGVAVDAAGQIYVGDRTTHAVRVHDSTGKLLRLLGSGPGEVSSPSDLAVDPASREVHVVDSALGEVKVYDGSGGQLLRSYAGPGSANGLLNAPMTIAHLLGKMVITDFNNSRVQRFSVAGTWDGAFGTYGTGKGQFVRPEGIAVDSQNRIYVSDVHVDKLQVIDGNGLHVSWLGSPGTGYGMLSLPLDAVVDSYGRLLVTSYRTGKVVIYGIDSFQEPDPEQAVPATVTIAPTKLQPSSEGRWVTATIEVPGRDLADLLVTSVRLANVEIDPAAPTAIGDADADGVPDLTAKFLRARLLLALEGAGSHELTLSGDLSTGEYIEGKTTIEVLGAKGGKP